MTFCITCKPVSTLEALKRRFRGEPHGMRIFIFKTRARSRAMDWMWLIWLKLGGKLPPTVQVWNPTLGSKIYVTVPGEEGLESIYEIFARSNLLQLCIRNLRSVVNFKELIQAQEDEGKRLQLAWRIGTALDWIWLDEDTWGDSRPWVVLCGLVLMQPGSEVHLELRLCQHYPSYLMEDDERLEEPHSIEGYATQIHRNGKSELVYLVTHDSNLFVLKTDQTFAPTPLGMTATAPGQMDDYAYKLRQSEVRRGTAQILRAYGVCDLMNIISIRRATEVQAPESHDEERPDHDDHPKHFGVRGIHPSLQKPSNEERTDSDDEDEGEETLNASNDKARLKMKRSFELCLDNEHVIRFEARTCKLALEWIDRLRELVYYWYRRHPVDTRDEMELSQSQRERITPLRHDEDDAPEPPPDPSAPLPGLTTIYNRCVMEGCKPIVKGGKLWLRMKYRGPFRFVDAFLTAGYITFFYVNYPSVLHTAARRKISLVDAYVTSGYLGGQVLPDYERDSNRKGVARKFSDGLEVDDPEEDLIFVIWYTKTVTGAAATSTYPTDSQASEEDERMMGRLHPLPSVATNNTPKLGRKLRTIVFKTRSKLERDSWCWALNCEIEKLNRSLPQREEKLRDAGNVVNY